MDIDFGALIVDLKTLAFSSKEDFSNKYWNSYESYVNQYNSILKDLQTLGFFNKLKDIQHVPFSEQEFRGNGFSKQEKAKLREITNASNSLLQKVMLLLRPPKSGKEKINQIRSNKILVIHGQDNEMKLEVTQTLQKLELDPILLDENPNITQNIIENIEDYDHISFAIVILSPDYLAYPNEKNLSEAKYIAKQNVIFELGYFLGKLGKQNVIVIYKKMKHFEIPNYNGIVWIEYKNGWYFDLIKELKERNFDVDANKLGWL